MKKIYSYICKITCAVFTAALLISIAQTTTHASQPISVTIDGEQVQFADQLPVIIDGRTLVPVGGVFNALGFTPTWDGAAQTATLTRDDFTVVITIGSTVFTSNGVQHTLDVPAQIIAGRTMLPLRAVLESINICPANIGWNDATRAITVLTGECVANNPHGYISEYGLVVVTEFLREFPSMFSMGSYVQRHVQQNPQGLVFQRDIDAMQILDVHGNPINADNVPFLLGSGYYGAGVANMFWLYHIDGSGIPLVVVSYCFLFSSQDKIFRYVNGEFRAFDGNFEWPRFYTDTHGQVIMASGVRGESTYLNGRLHYVTRIDSDILFSPIPNVPGFNNFFEGHFALDSVNIPNRPLVPVHPLGNIHTSISAEMWQYFQRRIETISAITQPNINHQPAYTFLSQMPPIFTGVGQSNSHVFWHNGYSYPYIQGFFNCNGNRIYNAPYINDVWIATDFQLFDFDNDGTLQILVSWEQFAFNGAYPFSLFRYINGQYREMELVVVGGDSEYMIERNLHILLGQWHRFYSDNQGRLILYAISGGGGGMETIGFLTFHGEEARFDIIASEASGAELVSRYGLTPVPRLTATEQEFRTQLTQ